MSPQPHIHAGPHVHLPSECSYEFDGFGTHLWCSNPTPAGGLCPECAANVAEQLSDTGTIPSVRFPATPITPEKSPE